MKKIRQMTTMNMLRRIMAVILTAVILSMLMAGAVRADEEPSEPVVLAETETDPENADDTEPETEQETEHVHTLMKIEAKAPTCKEDGNSAYWTCTECGAFFSDETGSTPIGEDSWIIPATGHTYNNDYCTICGARKDGWAKGSDGAWYYYSDGALVTGWKQIGGNDYWFDGSGRMKTGWQYISGEWYLFEKSGAMYRGWHKSGNIWYYLKSDGVMARGWAKDNGKWYYFDSSGAMQTGWKYVGGEWYYLKSSGAMYIGWFKSGKTWYYLKSSGAMARGWAKDNGKWYLFSNSGAMLTGWQYIGGKWYYLESSGEMCTDWFRYKGKWYYLKPSGEMAVGWTDIEDKRYYFDSSGIMKTGWVLYNGYWYYLNYEGEMVTDGIVLDKWYIKDGTVDYDFTGIVADYDGSWYVTKGCIDTSFNGQVETNGILYNVKNGMVTGAVDNFYFGTLFSSIAKDGNIHFGTTGSKYEIECVHACYCDVHSWTNPSTGHLGVDLICNTRGKELLAVASGTVVYVNHQSHENDGSYGSHPGEAVAIYIGNGLIYEYHELMSNSVTVNVGDHVNAGDVIGKVGLTGVTTGYHIHFSVLYWLGAEYKDDLSEMPDYEGPWTDGYIQLNPLFFFGESLAAQTEIWYAEHKYEWYGYKNAIPGDPRNYPVLAGRLMY